MYTKCTRILENIEKKYKLPSHNGLIKISHSVRI